MSIRHETQNTVNYYLDSIGLEPEVAVCAELLEEIVPLIPKFLAGGGKYHDPNTKYDSLDEWPYSGGGCDDYPTAMVGLSAGYGGDIALSKTVRRGYPVMRLHIPIYDDGYFDHWKIILVHPTHLDAALCYLFDLLPTNKGD